MCKFVPDKKLTFTIQRILKRDSDTHDSTTTLGKETPRLSQRRYTAGQLSPQTGTTAHMSARPERTYGAQRPRGGGRNASRNSPPPHPGDFGSFS